MAKRKIVVKNAIPSEDVLKKMFSGTPGFLGGLSNEEELAKICPKEFQETNPWSSYAYKLFSRGGNIDNWKWREKDEIKRKIQIGCFKGLMGSFGLSTEDKEAVVGWMLSVMLEEVPE